MTALNFCLKEDSLLLAMDTLATYDDEPRIPLLFTTKMFILPHMNCVICGVGTFEIILKWYEFVVRKIFAIDIVALNNMTQKHFHSVIPNECKDAYCTMYQFGINERTNMMNGFVYRRENNYRSEELKYATYTRPGLVSGYEIKGINIYKEFSEMMKHQKQIEDSKDEREKIYIGGMIQILEMTKDNIKITNYDKYDDFYDCVEQIERRMAHRE